MAGQKPPSHYDILGVSRTATEAEIKKAFKKAALKYHPDKAGPSGEEMFVKCRAAHDVLVDAGKRREYDQEQANPRPAFSNPRPSGSARPSYAYREPRPHFEEESDEGEEDWKARWDEAKREGDKKRSQRSEEQPRRSGYGQEEAGPRPSSHQTPYGFDDDEDDDAYWQSRWAEARRQGDQNRSQRRHEQSGQFNFQEEAARYRTSPYRSPFPFPGYTPNAGPHDDDDEHWKSRWAEAKRQGDQNRSQRRQEEAGRRRPFAYRPPCPFPGYSSPQGSYRDDGGFWEPNLNDELRQSRWARAEREDEARHRNYRQEERRPRPEYQFEERAPRAHPRSASQRPHTRDGQQFRREPSRREGKKSKARRRDSNFEQSPARSNPSQSHEPNDSDNKQHPKTPSSPRGGSWMSYGKVVLKVAITGERIALLRGKLQGQQQDLHDLGVKLDDSIWTCIYNLQDILGEHQDRIDDIQKQVAGMHYRDWDSSPTQPENAVLCEVISDIVAKIDGFTLVLNNVESGVTELFQLTRTDSNALSDDFEDAIRRLRTTISGALQ